MIKYKEFIDTTEHLIGRTLGEVLDLSEQDKLNKGSIGQRFEVDVYGKQLDTSSQPDLTIDLNGEDYSNLIFNDVNADTVDVELKVTPIKRNKNKTYSAKERLVLSKINYNNQVDVDFEQSHLYKKIKYMLIIFYEYKPDTQLNDMVILHAHYFNIKEEDIDVFKNDYNILQEMIMNGNADKISERQFKYLSACTKGASSKSVTSQPFSNQPAKTRAFSLKGGYMTMLFNKSFDIDYYKSLSIPKQQSIYEYLSELFKDYKGMSQKKMYDKFGISTTAKNKGQILISKILEIGDTDLSRILQFQEENIKFKVHNFKKTGEQEIKICSAALETIHDEVWEESDLYLETQKRFLFFIFNEKDNDMYFEGIYLFEFDDEEIEEFRIMFEDTKYKVCNGIELYQEVTPNRVRNKNNLYKKSDGVHVHVRPGASKGSDTVFTILNQEICKQAFWYNKESLRQKIENTVDQNRIL